MKQDADEQAVECAKGVGVLRQLPARAMPASGVQANTRAMPNVAALGDGRLQNGHQRHGNRRLVQADAQQGPPGWWWTWSWP